MNMLIPLNKISDAILLKKEQPEIIPYAVCLGCGSFLDQEDADKSSKCPNCDCIYCKYYYKE